MEGLKAEVGKVRSSRQSPVRHNVKIDPKESCAKGPSRAPEPSKNAEVSIGFVNIVFVSGLTAALASQMGYQPAIVGGKGIKGLDFGKLVNQNASELITKRLCDYRRIPLRFRKFITDLFPGLNN